MAGNTSSGRRPGSRPPTPAKFVKGNDAWIRKGRSGWKRRKEMDDLRLKAMGNAEMSPLEFALKLMADESEPLKVRMWACQTAMPYCHARVITVEGNEKKPLVVATTEAMRQLPDKELNSIIRTLGKLNASIAAQIDEADLAEDQKRLPYSAHVEIEDAQVVSETRRKPTKKKPKIR